MPLRWFETLSVCCRTITHAECIHSAKSTLAVSGCEIVERCGKTGAAKQSLAVCGVQFGGASAQITPLRLRGCISFLLQRMFERNHFSRVGWPVVRPNVVSVVRPNTKVFWVLVDELKALSKCEGSNFNFSTPLLFVEYLVSD